MLGNILQRMRHKKAGSDPAFVGAVAGAAIGYTAKPPIRSANALPPPPAVQGFE
jgi:hypothetical protein